MSSPQLATREHHDLPLSERPPVARGDGDAGEQRQVLRVLSGMECNAGVALSPAMLRARLMRTMLGAMPMPEPQARPHRAVGPRRRWAWPNTNSPSL